MKTDEVHIAFILDAIRKIESFTDAIDETCFMQNQLRQSGVILQLIIIGEAAKKITTATKSKIDLDWKEISGFRDVAVHDYFNLDLGIIWNTIFIDIPELKKKLQEYRNRG